MGVCRMKLVKMVGGEVDSGLRFLYTNPSLGWGSTQRKLHSKHIQSNAEVGTFHNHTSLFIDNYFLKITAFFHSKTTSTITNHTFHISFHTLLSDDMW